MQEISKRKNFTFDEKEKFLNIVERHIGIIESTNRNWRGYKIKVWDKITSRFNLVANENLENRTSQQLRTLYLNMKRRGNRRIRASLIANATCKNENEVKVNSPEPHFEESSIASSDGIVTDVPEIKMEPASDEVSSFDEVTPPFKGNRNNQHPNDTEIQNNTQPLNNSGVQNLHSMTTPLSEFIETQINSDESSSSEEIPQFKKRPKFRKNSTVKLKKKYYYERIKLTRVLRQSKKVQHNLDLRLKKLQIYELERKLSFCS